MKAELRQIGELSLDEIGRRYAITSEDFLSLAKEYKIPKEKSGNFKKSVLDKYFSIQEEKAFDSNIIAITNQKGGEGKTTLSLCLAEALSFESKVLLVDWDAQANATRLFFNDLDLTIYDCLHYRDREPRKILDVIQTVNGRFDLAPSSISLANLTTPYERDDFELLRDCLLPVRSSYEYIIIDCPPSLGLGLENALIAADYAIVPIQARAFSVQGIKDLHNTIEKIQKKANPNLKLLGAVLNQFEESRALSGISENVKKYFPVFQTIINRRESIPQSQAKRKLLSDYDKKALKNFQDLAMEVKQKIYVQTK
ncbi:MAG: AAA family ATPase [Leptospiraceae bacterium]|nr:AAA family ATPase [Leptospiraceae bacterium]